MVIIVFVEGFCVCGGGGGKNLSPAWAGLKGGFSGETERIVKYFVNHIKMFTPLTHSDSSYI